MVGSIWRKAMRAKGEDTEVDLTVRWHEYEATAAGCAKNDCVRRRSETVRTADQEVTSYVAAHSDRLIGFLCLCMPGFKPNDKRLDYLREYATRHALPVLLHAEPPLSLRRLYPVVWFAYWTSLPPVPGVGIILAHL